MEILITILAAAAGGVAGRKLKLPVGAMTGALLAVIAVRLIFQYGYLPEQTKVALQILSGALIGSRVTWHDISELKKMWLPVVVLIIGMVLMNLGSAGMMNAWGTVDFVTAYFSSAPGGLQDMALISADFGADTLIVSICQVCRVLYILIVFPGLYRFIYKRKLYPGRKKAEPEKTTGKGEGEKEDTLQQKQGIGMLATIVTAAAGGLLFKHLGVTAGALLGALILVAAGNVVTGKAYFPNRLKFFLQILTGAYVGMQVSRETLSSVQGILLPTVIMLIGTTLLIYLLSLAIYSVSGIDFMTCLLICTPGGLQEMCLLADDMECDAPKIVVMHTVRIIIVVSLCPIILQLIL